MKMDILRTGMSKGLIVVTNDIDSSLEIINENPYNYSQGYPS